MDAILRSIHRKSLGFNYFALLRRKIFTVSLIYLYTKKFFGSISYSIQNYIYETTSKRRTLNEDIYLTLSFTRDGQV